MPPKQWPNLVLCLKVRAKNPSNRLLGKRKTLESTAGVLWEAQNGLCPAAARLCQQSSERMEKRPDSPCLPPLPSCIIHRFIHGPSCWDAHVGEFELYGDVFFSSNFQGGKPGRALDILPVTGILTMKHIKTTARLIIS